MSEEAIPTLVVWGDDDRIFPPAHLEAAARDLPHARTRLFPETGHLPQIESAGAFADAVTKFWADVDVKTPDHRPIG
jgi:pimeloyl-ACP methyl ester carboxylesterase